MGRKERRERIRARAQEPVPQLKAPERKKVTPEQVAQKMDARRQEARQKAAADGGATRARRLRLGVTTLLLAGAAGVVLVNGSISSSNNEAIESAHEEVTMLVADKAAVEESVETMPEITEVKQAYTSAAEKGKQVAEQQNVHLQYAGKDEPAKLNGAKQALDPLFDEDAKSGRWDPRLSWIALPDGEGYTWTFESTSEMAGTEISVAWMLHDDESGELLMWVMGTYDGAEGTFTELRKGETVKATELIGATEGHEPEDDAQQAPEIGDPGDIGGDGEDL